jgi:hypothetical protein
MTGGSPASPTTETAGPATAPAPSLPGAIRAGAQLLGCRILSVEHGAGGSHHLELLDGERRFRVRLRPHDPARAPTLRRGPWALDVEAPASLSERGRAALVLLARALDG